MIEDNRRLAHRKPCADCPFRRDSVAGYLGGFRVETYAEPPEVGVPTSCHHEDWGARDNRTKLCAGSLSVIAAGKGISPWPNYAQAVTTVGPREDTFSSVDEFRRHHAMADDRAWR